MKQSKGVVLYRKLKRAGDRLDRILERLAVIMLALLVATIAFQVLYRFVIVKIVAFSFPFTEEFARYLLMWITYVVLGVCFKDGMHSGVSFLSSALPRKGKLVLFTLIRTAMLGFMGVVLVKGLQITSKSWNYTTPTLELPMAVLYLAVVVGAVLMLLQIILEMLGVFTGEIEPFATENKGEA